MTLASKLMATVGNGGATPVYIEDVFSTWLTTGAGATVNVVNGIDLATKGGLVWQKGRSGAATAHTLFDTARGINNGLFTNSTGAQTTNSNWFTAFNTDGFSFGTTNNLASSGQTGVNWTFRKQPKFFDVVTWTGDGTAGRQIPHSLGSVPGCIIVKTTSFSENWVAYHRSLPSSDYVLLFNTTSAQINVGSSIFGATPTSTSFTVGSAGQVNSSGQTYVAYLFAHNAGGFGLTGADNVISCGSYTTDGSGNASVTLGYEPQWVLVKGADSVSNWQIYDSMRGMCVGDTSATDAVLNANTTGAESLTYLIDPTATGFNITGSGATNTRIYIAIRRGPMKTPTSGTSVFAPVLSSANSGINLTTNFPVDLQITSRTTGTTSTTKGLFFDRLRGVSTTTTGSGQRLLSHSTATEVTLTNGTLNWGNTGFQMPGMSGLSATIFWNFQRAPGFLDEVCYTGDGTNLTLSHNLGVAPELIISKARNSTSDWGVYLKLIGDNGGQGLLLNNVASLGTYNPPVTTANATTFQARAANFGASGVTYVSYLFASCPGVSKVGSYTGTGSNITIDCGFTGGARFVLIKRTDSTGDWYVWDSARGMVSGTDPSLLLNSTAAEVNANSIYTTTGGFQIVSTAAGINASGGSYIYLSIA